MGIEKNSKFINDEVWRMKAQQTAVHTCRGCVRSILVVDNHGGVISARVLRLFLLRPAVRLANWICA